MKSKIIVTIDSEIDGEEENLLEPLQEILAIWKNLVLEWNEQDKVVYKIKAKKL